MLFRSMATFFGGAIINDGKITMREVGKGMFANKGSLTNNHEIYLELSGNGMEVETTGSITNNAAGIIKIDQAKDANGMIIADGTVTNHGLILINNHLGDSNGISIEDGEAINSGNIVITGGTDSYGINSVYASVTNNGLVNLTEKGTGIYSQTGYIDNYGTVRMENGGTALMTKDSVISNHGSVVMTNGGTGMTSETGDLYNNNIINITGDGGVGIKDGSRIQNTGAITMTGKGVIGISNAAENIASNTGTINIDATDTLTDSYAMYTEGDGSDEDLSTHIMNKGDINMLNGGIAMYAQSGNATNYAGSLINFTNRYGIGMQTEIGKIINDGIITGPEGMTGMSVTGAGTATNNGKIIITAEPLASQLTIGMKAENGGKIINNGEINITATVSKLPQTIGMYATGAGSIIENRGRILINGSDVNSAHCDPTGCVDPTLKYRWIVVENGARFSTTGYVSMFSALSFSLFTNDGSGIVEVGAGGGFEAPTIEGTVYAGASIVGDGFEDEYVNKNSFIGEDAGIDLRSGSVMYKSSLVKNESGAYDIVSTMNTYSDVLGASEMSEYLDANRNSQLGGDVFVSLLRSSANLQLLNSAIIDQFGFDLIPNFAKQNLDVLKSANAKINNTIFDNQSKKETRIMTGYDYYNRDQNGLGVFTGYEDEAHSIFVVGDKAYDETFRYGLGLGLSHFESDYKNGDDRKEVMVQLFAPLTTQFDETLALITTPRIGIGMGNYHRYADGVEYKSDTNNYYYGVTNELRKEFDVGFVTIEPTAEFNILGVYQDELKEKNGLTVKSANNVSVEAGAGLYAVKAFQLSEEDTLKFRVGGTYYHEFNNSFRASKAQMNGMAGSFHMESYETQRNRGVLSLSANWRHQMMNFYLQLSQYLEDTSATQIDAGVRYNFD